MKEIKSLGRGIAILNLLANSSDGLGATEIAQHLDIDKSAAFHLLQTLTRYNFAQQDNDTKRYTLGTQLVVLGQQVLNRTSLNEHARPFVKQLMTETGECAHLAIESSGQVLFIEQAESLQTLSVHTHIGMLLPPHCSSVGKVLLAFGKLPIPQPLQRYTPNTITDVQAFEAHLEEIRQQGFATDHEEYEDNVCCVAVPIYDHKEEVVAALGVSGPVNRMSLERESEIVAITQRIGTALSKQLSFR